MILEELYSNNINREVNPAVTANDFQQETVRTEINEYVFTEENLQGLYDILSSIRLRNKHHDGIWINGHYGSGKSHFLKYLNYCMDRDYQELALQRILNEMNNIDPFNTNLNFSPTEMRDLADWLKRATIQTIPFNIGTVGNINIAEQDTFLDVFLREFNRFRGFNNFNLALAQYLEKPLQRHGKLQEFHQLVEEEGFDWQLDANDLATTELPMLLTIANQLVPTLDTNNIEQEICRNNIFLSVESWTNELKQFLEDKGEDYRLIFLVDEVSQFINNRKNMMLQLQGLVEELHTKCGDKVWITCTAQQDLSEMAALLQINATSEDYGKIMGRFEVKVSLQSTTPEFITQRRILSKRAEVLPCLSTLYDTKRIALEQQFDGLPAGYRAFTSQQEFLDYYPFVPYQFTLMAKVFEAFVERQYVASEMRGSERSIIKVTHSIARETKSQQVGNLISFDQFFGSMFKNALTAIGSRAMQTANDVIREYTGDKDFAQRVLNILFMLCNLKEADKVVFSVTIPTITKLIMQDVDANKQALMDKVSSVIQFLEAKNIIRKEGNGDNSITTYGFYTEDEREVAIGITATQINNDTMATELQRLLTSYISMNNRENYATGAFSIGATVLGKNFLSNNPDVTVEFVFMDNNDSHTCALQNTRNKLVFFMAEEYANNTKFKHNFSWYCQCSKYLTENHATNEQRQATINNFRAKFQNIKRDVLDVELRKMFDNAVIISGNDIMSGIIERGQNRYKAALTKHFENLYKSAKLVALASIPNNSVALAQAIQRPKQNNEYLIAINPLTPPEIKVNEKLSLMLDSGMTITVKEIVEQFTRPPYGWNNVCTIYIINELVRRNMYELHYQNAGAANPSVIAGNITRDPARFTIVRAQQISTQLINDFITAWGEIFAVNTLQMSNDANELFDKAKSSIETEININNGLLSTIAAYPFAVCLQQINELFSSLQVVRDVTAFFQLVIDKTEEAKALIDKRKKLQQFVQTQLALYKSLIDFVDKNRDNWQYLPDEATEMISELQQLPSDNWPLEKLAQYKQYQNALSRQLNDKRTAIREEIKNAYLAADEQLQQLAQDRGINDYSANIDNRIYLSQQPESISTLLLNRSTDAYVREQTERIAQMGGPSLKPITAVQLKTRCNAVIKTSADVDRYIENIREQIMQHINNGEEIIIR